MKCDPKFLAILLLFFLRPVPVFGAETLTWEDCVSEASRNNPDIRAAGAVVQASRNGVKAAVSDYFPSLSLESSYTVNNSNLPGVNFDTREEFEAGAALRQNVFAGFKTRAGHRRSKALLTDSEAALLETGAEVSFGLKSAFARLLYAQDRIDLARTILERRRENARLVGLRFDGGSENKGSFLRSRALENQAEYDLAEARREKETAAAELARFLGRPGEASRDLRVRGSFRTVAPPKSPDFGAIALETPAYARASAQLDVAGAEVSLARGDLFPSLDASTSVSRLHIVDGGDSNRWSAGVQVSYPFLLGGRDIFEFKGAKAEKRRAEQDLRSVSHRLNSDLKAAQAGFQNAVERVALQENFLTAARVRAEIARSQYANGLTSFFDWDQIENDLILNEQNMLQTRRDALIAEAEWERSQGKGAW